jgi:hypothetical protein
MFSPTSNSDSWWDYFFQQKQKELVHLVTHALHLRCKNNEIENSLTGATNYKSKQRVCSAVYKKE